MSYEATYYAIWAPGVGYRTNDGSHLDRSKDRHWSPDAALARGFVTISELLEFIEDGGLDKMGGAEIRRVKRAVFVDAGTVL